MKVLILTVSTGQGHKQTAMAVSEYFEKQGEECILLDAYKYISPFLSDSLERGYLLTTHYLPKTYGTVYERLEHKKVKENGPSFLSSLNNAVASSKMAKYIEEIKPDVVISTHVFCATVMTNICKTLKNIVNVGIITDYTIHPFWEETDMDYFITPSHLLGHQCDKKGLPREKVFPTGIPIAERFTEKMSKEEARGALGIDDKPTVMFMMGSMGFGNMPKMIAAIDDLELDFQIICVCGNNAAAKKKIDKMEIKHKTYAYGYVNNVDVMMDAADFLITKPGGLSMSESLAKGLPTILIHPIPGHETRNLEFFINNGISMAVTKTFTIDEAVYQMLSNEWKMKNTGKGVEYIGKPDAVANLYKLVCGKDKNGNENKEDR